MSLNMIELLLWNFHFFQRSPLFGFGWWPPMASWFHGTPRPKLLKSALELKGLGMAGTHDVSGIWPLVFAARTNYTTQEPVVVPVVLALVVLVALAALVETSGTQKVWRSKGTVMLWVAVVSTSEAAASGARTEGHGLWFSPCMGTQRAFQAIFCKSSFSEIFGVLFWEIPTRELNLQIEVKELKSW